MKRIEFNHTDCLVNVCMPADISELDEQIIIAVIFNIPVEDVEGLMTREALGACIGANDFLLEQMKKMKVGSTY